MRDSEQVLVLPDSRHGPTPDDLQAIDYILKLGFPSVTSLSLINWKHNRIERDKKEVLAALAHYGVQDRDLFWVTVNDEKTVEFLKKIYE